METAVDSRALTAVIEGEAELTLSPKAVKVLREQGIRELDQALREVETAERDMPQFDAPEAKAQLEILGGALDRAKASTDVLWYLASDDEEGGT